MAQLFMCPQGHQWEGEAGVSRPGCPYCGAAAELVEGTFGGSACPDELPPPPRTVPGPPTVVAAHGPLLPGRERAAKGRIPLPSLPGYEVLAEIGRGGMGVVYKAWHQRLKRLVAIKMVLAGVKAPIEALARFRTEAIAVARLQHPNIVQIYEVQEFQNQPYLALEFVEGGSLEQLTGTPWPAPQAARLVETLARAMESAHRRCIIHRDLKPANVLLTPDGTPKITDFGLAKLLVGGEGVQTRAGSVLGTPNYMPPEQATGKAQEIGPPTDVYALGAILYELLTGRPPFQAASPLETIQQVLAEPPVPPRRLQPRLPGDLEIICLKCLQKDPHKRYGRAEELADDLRRFQAGEPIRARPVGTAQRLLRWSRREPALASLTAALVLIGVLAFAGVTRMWLTAEEQRRQAQQASAGLALDYGLRLCEQGDVGRGYLWLARSLQLAAGDAPLRQVICANLAAWHPHLVPLQAILPHQTPVRAVAFSGDGRLIATGGQDQTAQLWDRATGKPLGPPLPHQGSVLAVAFSPDGKKLLTGSGKEKVGWVQLWDVATGKPDRPPWQHGGGVRSVAFRPDGRRIATASADRTVRVWDLATGQPVGNELKHAKPVNSVAFSPDGKSLLTTSGHLAQLWDAETGKPLRAPLPHGDLVPAAVFSPDGKTILTASHDKEVRLWNVQTHQRLEPPLRHPIGVVAVAFSPDGRRLVTSALDGTTQIWDVPTRQVVGRLSHHDVAWSVAFSPDGRSVLTGNQGKTACVWEAPPLPTVRLLPHEHPVYALAFSPDGKTLLTGSGLAEKGQAQLWDLATGAAREVILSHPTYVKAVTFSPNGRMLLTADRTARLWDSATGQPLQPSFGHRYQIFSLAFSRDGQTLLTGSNDRLAQAWDAGTGRPRFDPPLRQGGEIRAVAISPDGKTFLTGCDEGKIGLWDAATGQLVGGSVWQHPGPILAAAFSPDGRTILTGGGDKIARLWDPATRRPRSPPLAHHNIVLAVAFHPAGPAVLTGSGDRAARLWDPATGRPIGPPLQHEDMVWAVAFSPDGKSIASGSGDRTVRLWPVPPTLDGTVEQIVLWAHAITGMELEENHAIRVMDAAAWQLCQQRLQELGGPPKRGMRDEG